jgi:hypothetical protein
MPFDLHRFSDIQRNGIEVGTPEYQEALEDYIDAALSAFMDAPEGEAISDQPYAGAWAGQFLRYGIDYCAASPPQMNLRMVEELLTELFPRKVSLEHPDEAELIVPELLALWQFLHREFQLAGALEVLDYLRELQPRFPAIMNDPSRFGTAKALFMAGQASGLDMSDPEQFKQFILAYNLSLNGNAEENRSAPPASASKKGDSAHRKKQRKLAKAARKGNRRRR